jgi:hypothetical protein
MDVTLSSSKQADAKNRVRALHVTRHYTPAHNILSTAPQLSISQKTLGTLPVVGNVMTKQIGATYIINKLSE